MDILGHLRVGALAASAVTGSLSCGCDKNDQTLTSPGQSSTVAAAPMPPAVLVELDWLGSHRQDPKLIILDARTAENYAAGHIDGAVSLAVESLIDPARDHSHHIASLDKVQTVFSNAGVSMDCTVVVYDQGEEYREASRVFYVLESHGHPHACVLNGGFRGWSKARQAVSTHPFQRAHTQFVANMQPDRMATKLSVARAMHDPANTILLDARSPQAYSGAVSEEAARAGHIPGAINIEAKQTLQLGEDSVCRIKYCNDLLSVYSSLPKDHKIITYCSTGRRASVSYLALRSLGYDVALYDGAWMEWASDPSLPIELSPGITPTAAIH